MRPSHALVVIATVVVSGCGTRAPAASGSASAAASGSPAVLQAADDEPVGSAAPRAPVAPLSAGQRIDVPGGKWVTGSTPGDRGRDPTLEPALVEVELGPFSIDRYAWPNDPTKPPLVGLPRDKAQALCEQAGGRLCTELEWERACKGPEGAPYATGAAWDPACAQKPLGCASGFGALGLGTLREWTASDVAPVEGSAPLPPGAPPPVTPEPTFPGGAAVRGAKGDAPPHEHRCARRAPVAAGAGADDLGFRCCHGPKNAASIPAPKWQETFRKAPIAAKELGEILKGVPHLAEIAAEELAYFKDEDAKTALARADAGAPPPNTTLTASPLLWSPVPGEEVLVAAARAGKSSVIVALHVLGGGRYRIASSLVLRGEKGPVLLGWNPYLRRKVSWGVCWECNAESGSVTFREDNRVVVIQR